MGLYKIADLPVLAEVSHPRCIGQLEKYRLAPADAEISPLIRITVTQKMIDDYREAGKDSEIIKDWSVAKQRDEVEYMLAGAVFYRELLSYQGMLLHASAVVVDGKAYLFSGKSGTGKSTHTGLWLQYFGERAYILNDDKPAIRMEKGRLYAYGTPWSGKTNMNVNRKAPVAGIVFLGQAAENQIRRLSAKEAFSAMFEQTQRNLDGKDMIRLLDLMERIIETVPIYHMDCNISADAVLLSWNTLQREEK